MSLILLSTSQKMSFEYRDALQSLEQAEALAGQLQDSFLSGSIGGNFASVYALVGDWPSANSEAIQAITFLQRISKPDVRAIASLAKALQLHASICFHLENYPDGYRDLAAAMALADSLQNVPLETDILDSRGSALTLNGNISEAGAALEKALILSDQLQDTQEQAIIKEHLAELELKKDHPNLARALLLVNEALSSGSPLFRANRQYFAIHIRAKILLESGRKEAALNEFMRAVTVANQWRIEALPGDATSTQTAAALQDVYRDYAQLAAEISLEKHDKTLAIQALEVLAENRAASLRDQLRNAYGMNWKLPDIYFAELSKLQAAQVKVTLGQNKSEDRAELNRIRYRISNLENQIGIKPNKILVSQERNPRRNSLRDIQNTLGRGQVLISFTLGKRQSFLWTVTGDRVNLSKLPGEAEILSKAVPFSEAVHAGSDFSGSARALSQAFFSGLPQDVWNRSEWMIVADGPLLSGVPFGALPQLQNKSLRFLPSELLLLDKHDLPLKDRFVGVADPIYNLADSRLNHSSKPDFGPVAASVTLARLVGSGREVRSAATESHILDPIFLTGAQATRQNLATTLNGENGIVHFAVHVVSPAGQPQQAALALSLKDGMPELLTPEVVAAFHTPGSLVVLSGCSSGQGKIVAGAGLIGLSRAWLLAGAAAVVVSNWPTPDDSGQFFSSFYSHLEQIKSGDTAQRAALALRRAQLDMQRGSGYQRSSAFWGAFAVISKE